MTIAYKEEGKRLDITDIISLLNQYTIQYPESGQYLLFYNGNEWQYEIKEAITLGESESPREKRFQKLLDYLENNYDDDEASFDFALEQMALRKSEFSRYFKKKTGMTFINYRNAIRIRKAGEWLRETDMSCEQIAFRCGFSSYLYFKKVFMKEHGVSPRDYRLTEASIPM